MENIGTQLTDHEFLILNYVRIGSVQSELVITSIWNILRYEACIWQSFENNPLNIILP